MKLLFDIGGTRTRIATSQDGHTFDGEPIVKPTPKAWSAAEDFLRDLLSQYRGVEGVCGGLPGVFNTSQEILKWSPNLPDWVDKPIAELISEVTNAPVRLYNDAVLAGIGEATAGAGRGFSIVAYLTVSTGVGGARVINGLPDERHAGFEPGHQIIDFEKGTMLEDLASGAAFIKKYGPDFITVAPQDAWEEAARALAAGIHNTLMYWSPDVLVMGGPMVTKPKGISMALVREQLAAMPRIFPEMPPIRIASLEDKNGLYGALAMHGAARKS